MHEKALHRMFSSTCKINLPISCNKYVFWQLQVLLSPPNNNLDGDIRYNLKLDTFPDFRFPKVGIFGVSLQI